MSDIFIRELVWIDIFENTNLIKKTVLDYANTSKNKTVRSLVAVEDNTNCYLPFNSGLWQNTNAISTIVISPNVGSQFNQYSSFALYGIKG